MSFYKSPKFISRSLLIVALAIMFLSFVTGFVPVLSRQTLLTKLIIVSSILIFYFGVVQLWARTSEI